MTREDKLYSMRMQDLKVVADKLGIKINPKAAKSQAVEKILLAEEMNKQNEKEITKEEKQIKKIIEEPERLRKLREERNKAEADVLNATAEVVKKIEEPKLVPMPGTEDPDWGKKHVESFDKPERKRGAKIEYNGKSQNICAWAKELGVSANTLYSRIYILGWDIEKAFTYKRS